MIIPDANLLLYAYDSSSPFHLKAKKWCEKIMTGPDPVAMIPVVLFGFVRVSTHSRIFETPLRIEEAAACVQSWIERPHVMIMEMNQEDVMIALKQLQLTGVAGNLTSDAQIAAVAQRLHGEVHTADLDFERFSGVRHLNPLFD